MVCVGEKLLLLLELPRYHPEHISQHPASLLNPGHGAAPSVPAPAGAASAGTATRQPIVCWSCENRLRWVGWFFPLHFFLEMPEEKEKKKKKTISI